MTNFAFPPHDPVSLGIAGTDIRFNTTNLHYEVELVVAIGPDLEVFGYGVGIDLTRRDLQASAKKKGGPWARAKNFNRSAPCSVLTPADEVDLSQGNPVGCWTCANRR